MVGWYHQLNGHGFVWTTGVGNGQGSLVCCGSWGRKKSTRVKDFPFTFHFDALEKEIATTTSVLAWRFPGMGEPGVLTSMASHRFGHD